MTDPEKINILLADVVDKMKPYYSLAYGYQKPDKLKYPEFYDGYNMVCSLYDEILVHSELKVFPESLIGKRSPNMTDAEYNYVKANYKPVSVPVFIDFVNSVQRCWNDGNWNITWPEESELNAKYKGENSLRRYVENNYPEYGSFENYFRYLFSTIKIKDANGVIAERPKKYERNDEGQYYEKEGMRVPELIYFSCKQVVKFEPSEYYMIHSHEKTIVSYMGKNVKEGHVFEFYTKDSIYIIEQTGKYTDWTFEVKLLMKHDLGEVPVNRIGGIPFLYCDKLFYLSTFSYAVPNLDLVILNASNLQLSINNCVYPIRVMIGNECEFQEPNTGFKCIDGYINDQANNIRRPCTACGGTGLRTRLSPLGNILIRPKTSEGDAEVKASEAIYYASPSTETLKFLEEKILSDEIRARGILHLYNSSTKAQGTDNTATDSNIDQKANYAFIKPISDQIFGMFQWALDIAGKYREGKDYKKAEITFPNSFDFYTEKDYLNQISGANNANLPHFVIYSIVWKFLNTLYYTEKETSKRFYLVMAADRLITLNSAAISLGLTKGTIANWEAILHESAINLIGELERDNDDFWKKEPKEQIEMLVELAKTKDAEIRGIDPDTTEIESKLATIGGGATS